MKNLHLGIWIHFAMASVLALGLVGCTGATSRTSAGPAAIDTGAAVSPAEAVSRLIDGNARFVAGHTLHPRQYVEQRNAVAMKQYPFAVILGCADSRTGPEILFDQGLGDLFVVREAGNVVDDHAIGSIEYAVEHLHAPLVVVLGHKRCGAIVAARDTVASKGHAEGHIDSLVSAIRPAVEATVGRDVEATCKANVANMVQALRTSEPILRHLIQDNKVRVIGAYYDLDSGAVTFLKED